MKKIIISLSIIAASAAIIIGATSAYFSDTETSTGNTFTAGTIDLKIGNDSYVSDANGDLVASENTSWLSKDLTTNEKFFNFSDLKPGDVGEDTISLEVGSNNAWVCAEIALTSNKDNDCTEPELEAEGTDCVDNVTDGELADNISFAWWPDDGDNVLEVDEVPYAFFESGASISDLMLMGSENTIHLTLADSVHNFFGEAPGTPLNGGETYHIGKGWCFGEMTLVGAVEDNTDPVTRGETGFLCDGSPVDNASQSDSLTADLSFTAVQTRNNDNHTCPDDFR